MSLPPTIDALTLRVLADAAASWRGPQGHCMYVLDKLENGRLVVEPGTNDHPPAGAVVELKTEQQRSRPAIKSVKIKPKCSKAFHLKEYDAVFWSEAAVEKFVIPYYASKSLWTASCVLTALSNAWFGKDHCKSSTGDDTEPAPFAVAHLPGSDYVPLAGDTASAAEHACWDLDVLLRLPDGSVQRRRLAEYLDRAPDRP
jgi:hypothetical protein